MLSATQIGIQNPLQEENYLERQIGIQNPSQKENYL